jgi:radical SAM superfamily enzyme YgiQ (UPF0313 family)
LEKSVASRDEDQSVQVEGVLDRLFPSRDVRRVLFITPPDVDATLFSFDTAKRGRYSNYPPYGLMSLATSLRSKGVTVDVVSLNSSVLKAAQISESAETFDFDGAWQSDLDAALSRDAFDMIGITCMFTQTHDAFQDVCDRVKKTLPDVPVIVGGVHVTNALTSSATADQFLEAMTSVDAYFVYECDDAIERFVDVVRGEQPTDALRQLHLKTPTGLLSFTGRTLPGSESLDRIPAHDLGDPREWSAWGKVGAYTFLRDSEDVYATVLSNRGCRAQCTFCSVRNFNGVGVRRRNVQSVIDELLMLRYEFDVRHIMWLDDDFLYDRKASLKLLNEMVRQNVDLTWDCTNGVLASSCTDEMIAAAVASGCLGLNIGMESGNPDMLRKIRKPASVKTLLSAADVLRRYPEIFARVFLIIGFPHETFRQMRDTYEVSAEMGLDWYQIQVLQPLPNTPIFDEMVEAGLFDISDFKEIRYSGGTYGRAAKRTEDGRDMLDRDFKSVFSMGGDADVVPKPLFEDVWAYLNFHLNYLKISQETRPVKLDQYRRYLAHITDVIAPNDALAHYYLGYIQKTLDGSAQPDLVNRLRGLMSSSSFWSSRFADFDLSIDDIDSAAA